MNTEEILKAIDEQIAKLQQARELLVVSAAPAATAAQRGRPKGSKNKVTAATATKRTMSAEGKARIAAAQRLRWSKQNKTAPKPATKRVASPKKAAAKPSAEKKKAAVVEE